MLPRAKSDIGLLAGTDEQLEKLIRHLPLGRGSQMAIVEDGDLAIMHTCLDFIELTDFDTIVAARLEASAASAQRATRLSRSPAPGLESSDSSSSSSSSGSVPTPSSTPSYHSARPPRHSTNWMRHSFCSKADSSGSCAWSVNDLPEPATASGRGGAFPAEGATQ